MKRIVALLLALVLILSLVACGNNATIKSGTIGLKEDTEFGGIYIKISGADFDNLGFEHGDSVNLKFSNGKEFSDIPYFTGYYVKTDEYVLVDYEGYEYIKLAKNLDSSFWKESGVTENDTVEISLNEKSKFLDIEMTLKQKYSDDRNTYQSDEEFANFRPLGVSTIKENYIFRGASPIDNQRSRVEIVNKLLEKNNVQYEIDIADSKEEYEEFAKEDTGIDYALSLKANNKISYLNLSADYRTDKYIAGVVEALRAIIDNDGPFYIHCLEGKDRTGYICLLIETLSKAPIEEIKEDYLKTYENYYGIIGADKEIVANLYLLDMMKFLTGKESFDIISEEDLEKGVIDYVAKGGFTEEEITKLREKICK